MTEYDYPIVGRSVPLKRYTMTAAELNGVEALTRDAATAMGGIIFAAGVAMSDLAFAFPGGPILQAWCAACAVTFAVLRARRRRRIRQIVEIVRMRST